ncbi:hypothetical protein QTG56_19880 [Rossellomorea sp. AcN35-11]|nr:hypothetical protein [Rossellomorea aquimaris]WJV29202.1 hypothetical protein QTG56_19880 [Rossellomorea sp. AcN35-11]
MSEEKKMHPFDQMMYGERTRNKEASSSQEEQQSNGGASLFEGVHSIMNSIDELKPLYEKISPLLNRWYK